MRLLAMLCLAVVVSGCSKVEMTTDRTEGVLSNGLPRPIPPMPYPPTPRQPFSEAKSKSKEVSALRYGFVTGWAKDQIFIRALLQEALSDGVLTDDEYDRIQKVRDEEDLAKAKAAAFDLLNSEMSIQVTEQ